MLISGKLVTTSAAGDTTNVALSGKLDEDSMAKLLPIKDKLAKNVVVDFAKITHVNSVGVRDWIKFLRLISPNRSVSFVNCTDEIVRSIAMVREFAENAKIKSLARTYTCEKCDHDVRLTLERDIHFSASGPIIQAGQPPLVCKSCSQPVSAVIPDEEYFAFLGGA